MNFHQEDREFDYTLTRQVFDDEVLRTFLVKLELMVKLSLLTEEGLIQVDHVVVAGGSTRILAF